MIEVKRGVAKIKNDICGRDGVKKWTSIWEERRYQKLWKCKREKQLCNNNLETMGVVLSTHY